MAQNQRSRWSSNLGFILAAVGSAIGLGNIWRFSYKCHEHGGGIFLVPYFVALLVVGIPLMLLEYGFGHRERASSPLCFRRVGRGWEWIGWWMPVTAMFGIMLYYAVVIGWCVNYLFYSIGLQWHADPQGFFLGDYLQVTQVAETFAKGSAGPMQLGAVRWPILFSTLAVWVVCWIVCFREVSRGIEIACKIFMPLLFVLTLILVGWTISLDGAKEAIRDHYLHFSNWARLNPFQADAARRTEAIAVWRDAFGQIFFTLSLGFGIMITYASYLPRKSDIVANAVATSLINCIYSFTAGFAVFGVVGFMAHSQGISFAEAVKGGPQLAFVVYPKAVELLPGLNSLFGAIFFLVLILAGISSGISLVEAFTCSVTDKFAWKREKVVTAVCALGFLGSIIFTTQAGLVLLDIVDHFVTNFGLVFGGLMECLIVGWIIRSSVMRRHIERASNRKVTVLWDISIKAAAPLILAVILFNSFKNMVHEGYEGYKTSALLLFGLLWMGVCLVAAIVLALKRWRPEQLRREHLETEDELLV